MTRPNPTNWLQGGAKARPEHLRQAEAKAPEPQGRGGRPPRHEPGSERVSCRVPAAVARDLRHLALDTKTPLGLVVTAALQEALANPAFRARFDAAVQSVEVL